jgi:hypothetical protein
MQRKDFLIKKYSDLCELCVSAVILLCLRRSRAEYSFIVNPEEPHFSGRPDILIQVEQISRVILRFQRPQALVVRPIGCRDGVFALILS